MEPIAVEVQRLRARCADPDNAADPELSSLLRRYLLLLESEPVPSDPLRRDIRRDLARSRGDEMRSMVVGLLLAAVAVFAFAHWVATVVSPTIASTVGLAVDAGLMLTIPAIVATEAAWWRSSLRASSRRELNALLPAL